MALPVPTIAVAVEGPVYGVKITVGVGAGTERLDIYRVGPSGVQAYVRTAYGKVIASAPSTVVVRDYETPFGVPVTYTARVYKADGSQASSASAAPFTLTPPSADPWLTDLVRPLNSQPITVESFGPQDYEQPVGLHRVLERRAPVVTADLAWTPSAELVFCTLDEDSRDRARASLGNGVPVLLRTLPAQGVGNVYLILGSWKEDRVSRIATLPERRFSCQVTQIDRPDPRVYIPRGPVNYETVKATYATYAALKATGKTYDALLYDYSLAEGPGLAQPWPPTDV